jgi:lysophospholipase L1-like esterase
VEYGGAQLAFADAFLAAHPKTRLVTIDIGANDVSNLRDGCGGVPTCILGGLPAVLAKLSANLDTIYGHLRTVDGYHHKLVALTIYSTDYADPALTGVVMALNNVVAARTLAWGGIVADGFGAWASAAAPYGGDTCAAGLRIVTSTSPVICDDHPAAAGHRLLAQAIVQALRTD